VADLKGLKMRGPVPLYIDMFNALGASGTMVTWTEVYTALQTGVVDGMEASPSLIYAMKFHEQAKFLSKTYHIGANFYIVTGKKWFEQLPKDLQQVFVDAVEEVSRYQVDLQAKLDREDMDKLIKEGVKVNEVESLEEFQKAVIPWRDKYVKDKGPKFETFYQKMLAVK
jgi:C4-dicarboxylate-binding protein DctP